MIVLWRMKMKKRDRLKREIKLKYILRIIHTHAHRPPQKHVCMWVCCVYLRVRCVYWMYVVCVHTHVNISVCWCVPIDQSERTLQRKSVYAFSGFLKMSEILKWGCQAMFTCLPTSCFSPPLVSTWLNCIEQGKLTRFVFELFLCFVF